MFEHGDMMTLGLSKTKAVSEVAGWQVPPIILTLRSLGIVELSIVTNEGVNATIPKLDILIEKPSSVSPQETLSLIDYTYVFVIREECLIDKLNVNRTVQLHVLLGTRVREWVKNSSHTGIEKETPPSASN
jgi:hypothetical protein